VTNNDNLVDLIGSSNDSVTFAGVLAPGSAEFVNSAGFSADQIHGQNPTGANDTINVNAMGLTLYLWEYRDSQGDVETPTINYLNSGIAASTTVVAVSSMITASAAFAFASSGGATGVGSLDRPHEGEAPLLAAPPNG